MKYKIKIFAVLICSVLFLGLAKNALSDQYREEPKREKVAKIFSHAFDTGNLSQLWQVLGKNSSVRVLWENSLLEGKDEVIDLKDAAQVKKWLKNLHKNYRKGYLPSANLHQHIHGGTLNQCQKETCEFNLGPILHNNLYLKKVVLKKLKQGQWVIGKVYLYDGN